MVFPMELRSFGQKKTTSPALWTTDERQTYIDLRVPKHIQITPADLLSIAYTPAFINPANLTIQTTFPFPFYFDDYNILYFADWPVIFWRDGVCYEQLGRYKFMASLTEQQYLLREMNVSLVNPAHCLRPTTIICTQRAYHVRMPAVQESGKCISSSLASRRKRDHSPQNPATNTSDSDTFNTNPQTSANEKAGPMNFPPQQPHLNNLLSTFQLYQSILKQMKSSDQPSTPIKPSPSATIYKSHHAPDGKVSSVYLFNPVIRRSYWGNDQ